MECDVPSTRSKTLKKMPKHVHSAPLQLRVCSTKRAVRSLLPGYSEAGEEEGEGERRGRGLTLCLPALSFEQSLVDHATHPPPSVLTCPHQPCTCAASCITVSGVERLPQLARAARLGIFSTTKSWCSFVCFSITGDATRVVCVYPRQAPASRTAKTHTAQ